jgi:Pyruvate/2-oxoacid:ferredoxin oxidoreductase delta subunit
MRVKIIDERCPAQTDICQPIKQCPAKAITYKADLEAPLGGRMSIDQDKCDGCGICIDLCCGQAII